MRSRPFGRLGTVSALTLGGGGIGQVWGATSRAECIATVREAVESGISFLDVAPMYGNGEAERVVGEAFGGRLPAGVRISTKCRIDSPPAGEVLGLLERSLNESFERTRLDSVDLFVLHNQIVSDVDAGRYTGTTRTLFRDAVIPALEKLRMNGRIGAWGITGVGVPEAILETLEADPAPFAAQCVANLLDSPGNLRRFDGPARSREIIAAAARRGVGVMGIRAVQAGALTDGFDRPIRPEQAANSLDYERAAPFRALAAELGESPASLAYRYALGMEGVSTLVLGVKNRVELRECIEAERRGPLDRETARSIDRATASA